MTKRDKNRSKRKHPKEADDFEWLTVAWMLTVMTTLVCELGAAATAIYVSRFNPQSVTIRTLGSLLLFAAIIIGTISLLMLPVAAKKRPQPIPRPVAIGSVFIGGIPWMALVWQLMP